MTRSKKELKELNDALYLTDTTSSDGEVADDYQTKKLLQQSKKHTECSWALGKKTVIVSFLMTAYLLCNMAFSTIAPFFPNEGAKVGVSPAMIGVIIGVSPLCVAIASPAIGYLLPRTGFQLPVLLGLFQVGTSYVLLGFVNLFPTWAFILTSFLLCVTEGVGTALFVTSVFATFPVFFPSNVGTLMGFSEVASGLGYGIGLAVGGALYEAGGYKLPFVTVGAAVMLISVPCTILVRNIHSIDKPKCLPTQTTLSISTDLVVIALVLSIVMGCIGFSYNYPTIQLFLQDKFHYRTIIVAAILLICPTVCLITNIIVGPLVDKLGHDRGFIIFGLIAGGLSIFVMGIVYASGVMTPLVIITNLFVYGIASAFEIAPVYSAIVKFTSEKYLRKDDSKEALTSLVSGLLVSAYFFGEFFGALVGGTLNSYVSYPITAVIVGEIILAEALLLLGVTMIERI